VTPRALIVDWGGVLTPGVPDAMREWAASEGLDVAALRDAFGPWHDPDEARPGSGLAGTIELMERGEVDPAQVERVLADRLSRAGGRAVPAEGLLARMFSFFTHAEDMAALVRRAHRIGIATALLSNSWGDHYPDHLWDGTFDVVVLSGEVGMRKPDPAIFLHTVALLGVPAAECVFVDDLPPNVAAAVDLGMIGVIHRDYEQTADELCVLFDRDLRASEVVG
jgi:epoxide hydrolase-like predicted phosphatase